MRFNWRALWVTALFAALVIVAPYVIQAVDEARSRRHSTETLPLNIASTLDDGPIEPARTSLGARAAFELNDGGVRAFAFDRHHDNWDVVFYRRIGTRFERFGQDFAATGFTAPTLEGSPPILTMRMISMGLRYTFRATDQGVVFAPEDPRFHVEPVADPRP